MLAGPGALGAQAHGRRTVRGHVLLGSARGRPVAGQWVVLHRVTTANGAPVDSLRSDGAGAFTFRVTAADTTALYLASARYDDIAYFSEPVRVTTRDILLDPILVYHTSATGPPVGVSQRLLTVARAKADGSRDVLELVELLNPGPATRIAADTLQPTWRGVLPTGAIQFQAGQGDVSPEAVGRRGDTALVFAPLPPAQVRQVSFGYTLPASVRQVVVPMPQTVDDLEFLLEDTTAVVTGPRVQRLAVTEVEGRRFVRYALHAVPAGTAVTIQLGAPRFDPARLVPVVVALLVIMLGGGLWLAFRRPPS
ncbi:MAG TPA: hypothetical protein VF923_04020 [Gemmatimonadales bacterium]